MSYIIIPTEGHPDKGTGDCVGPFDDYDEARELAEALQEDSGNRIPGYNVRRYWFSVHELESPDEARTRLWDKP